MFKGNYQLLNMSYTSPESDICFFKHHIIPTEITAVKFPFSLHTIFQKNVAFVENLQKIMKNDSKKGHF